MKKLALSMMLGAALSASAQNKEMKQASDTFGGFTTDSTYNLITGLGELSLGSLWLSSVRNRVHKAELLADSRYTFEHYRGVRGIPGTDVSKLPLAERITAHNKLLNDRLAYLEEASKNRGAIAGRIQGFRIIGEGLAATIMIWDGMRRTYEWSAAQLEPRFAPEIKYMSDLTGIELKDLPMTPEETARLTTLKQERDAFHGTFPDAHKKAVKEIESAEGDYARRNSDFKKKQEADHAAAQQRAHDDKVASSQKDFKAGARVRTSTDDLMVATAGGVKLVGSAALFTSALKRIPNPAASTLARAEKLMREVENLPTKESHQVGVDTREATIRGLIKQISDNDGELSKLEAKLEQLADTSGAKISYDSGNGVGELELPAPAVKPSVLKQLQERIAAIKALRSNRNVRLAELQLALTEAKAAGESMLTKATKHELQKISESTLANARRVHAQAAIRDARLTGWKVLAAIGGTVLISDTVGNVLEWKAAQGDPSFSPLFTYMKAHGGEYMDKAIDGLSEQTGVTSRDVRERFKRFSR